MRTTGPSAGAGRAAIGRDGDEASYGYGPCRKGPGDSPAAGSCTADVIWNRRTRGRAASYQRARDCRAGSPSWETTVSLLADAGTLRPRREGQLAEHLCLVYA